MPHHPSTALNHTGVDYHFAGRDLDVRHSLDPLRHRLAADPRLARTVAAARQVHGRAIALAHHGTLALLDEAGDPGPAQPDVDADALITGDADTLLTIRTADCVPVLLASHDGRWVAAAHAGWRGIVAEVIPRTVAALARHARVEPSSIAAAVGPCIGVDHYEVGDEVVTAFRDADLAPAIEHRPSWRRPHANLAAAASLQLQRAGLSSDRIDVAAACTFAQADAWFSYRREGAQAGRQVAMISPRPAH